MYGLVNKGVEELIVKNFGEEKWAAVKAKAGVDIDVFISNESYPDNITYDLIGAASEVLGVDAEKILIQFGEHWVQTANESYGAMMKSGGRTLKEFLLNLPNFHTRVAMIYPNLQPPRFECSDVSEDGMKMHYFTHRRGLTSFVIGLLRGLGTLYSSPCDAQVIERRDDGADHDVFQLSFRAPA